MNSRLILCEKLNSQNAISTLDEWFLKCPPQRGEKHWVDGRSAKETAKHWLRGIPRPFIDILSPYQLEYLLCSPEYVSAFDGYSGNGRNHDLLLVAKDCANEKVVISVESKVDETFGQTVEERIHAAQAELKTNKNSNALKRIEELRMILFGKLENEQLQLRYQLLTAVAGTVAEAKIQGAATAFFIAQTFLSERIDKQKHKQNQIDLDNFIRVLSVGKTKNVKNAEMIGSFTLSNENEYLSRNIKLWIGKYEIEI